MTALLARFTSNVMLPHRTRWTDEDGTQQSTHVPRFGKVCHLDDKKNPTRDLMFHRLARPAHKLALYLDFEEYMLELSKDLDEVRESWTINALADSQ